MAKRFTSQEKWGDAWYRELSAVHKLLFIYICDSCDMAGVWNVDLKLASFQIGLPIEEDAFMVAMQGRVIPLPGFKGRWRVVKFIHFQQGLPLNPKNKAHQSIQLLCNRYKIDLGCIEDASGMHLGSIEDASSPVEVKVKVKVESSLSSLGEETEERAGDFAQSLTQPSGPRDQNPLGADCPPDLRADLRPVWAEIAVTHTPEIATRARDAARRFFGAAVTPARYRETYMAAFKRECLERPATEWPNFKTEINRDKLGPAPPQAPLDDFAAINRANLQRKILSTP